VGMLLGGGTAGRHGTRPCRGDTMDSHNSYWCVSLALGALLLGRSTPEELSRKLQVDPTGISKTPSSLWKLTYSFSTQTDIFPEFQFPAGASRNDFISLMYFDRCCFYYFARKSRVALLRALCAQFFSYHEWARLSFANRLNGPIAIFSEHFFGVKISHRSSK